MVDTPAEKEPDRPSWFIKLRHWLQGNQPLSPTPPKRRIIYLDGTQRKQLDAALVSAFPTYEDLEMMVRYELDEQLSTITNDKNIKYAIFKLIDWAIARGRLDELIHGALQHNPQSPQLITVAEQLGLPHAHTESPAPTTVEEQQSPKAQAGDDPLRIYLLALRQIVHQLPRLGLGVSDIAPIGVSLTDIFIPTELRESPKALKLLPFAQDEITAVTGLDPHHRRYLMVDPRGEWERIFMQRDRIDIPTLWQCLSVRQPAAVVQGGPGTGKSTLLARITLAMISQGLAENDAQLSLTPTLIPMLILIKEYADYLDQLPSLSIGNNKEQRSLLTFIIENIKGRLEKKGVANAEQIAREAVQWLRAGRCLVMFDGLDEVSKKPLQDEIQQAIHNFIERQCHPEIQTSYNRFLITSRIAEYDAPALEDYRYFLLAELSKEQMFAFIPRWYQASISGMAAEKKQEQINELTTELTSAIDKNEAVRKLAENPLLLTLMAIMLYNGTSLPERRVELYEAVVKTLLESRNATKGLQKLRVDEAIQRIGPLAFTMQGKKNSLARLSEVKAAVKKALISPSGSSAHASEEQITNDVNKYIALLGERGGLFVLRTGDYYGFIHRSFQEYFAARHMLREIELNRDKITEYVKLVRNDLNTWREPFILAVAAKSAGDTGPVATAMLQALLPRTKGTIGSLHDLLLAATCLIEANYINIDATLQRNIADRLLIHYELAQKELRFDDCNTIEEVVRDWLLVLQAEEDYLELPHALHDVICNTRQPKRQLAALTLLSSIMGQLRSAHYNIYPLLVPPLLALCGLDGIGQFKPTPQLSISADLDVADMALLALSFTGTRGPAGWLLQKLRQDFKNNPQLLHDLARYSLECGTLITPTVVPLSGENYQRYEAAVGQWLQVRDSDKRTRIKQQDIATCLAIHQTLLGCAEEAEYPIALHICTMLQQATSHPKQWRSIWKAYIKEQLNTGCYVNYQQVALLWITLFPEEQNLQLLANCVLSHYHRSQAPNDRYSQRFLASLSFDLRELRSSRDLRDLRDLGGLRGLRGLRGLEGLIDWKGMRDLRDLRGLRDLRDLRELRYLRELSGLRGFIDLRDLRDLLLNKNTAEQANTLIAPQRNAPNIDLFTILMGRVLQLQENNKTGPAVEAEVQKHANTALATLTLANIDAEIREAALDVVRYLPVRTEGEVQFVWQVVNSTTDGGIHEACAYALRQAEPKDDKAWEALKLGGRSGVEVIREVVGEVLKRWG